MLLIGIKHLRIGHTVQGEPERLGPERRSAQTFGRLLEAVSPSCLPRHMSVTFSLSTI